MRVKEGCGPNNASEMNVVKYFKVCEEGMFGVKECVFI